MIMKHLKEQILKNDKRNSTGSGKLLHMEEMLITAFYSVVVAEDDKLMQPREALNEYVEYIDAEITNKRQEFGMNNSGR